MPDVESLMLVASTRMYDVAPKATAAWRRLLEWVSSAAGVPLDIVAHAHPATLADLWGRTDLGCAFMCDWPLAQERGQRPVIAAPVPIGECAARYHSVLVVTAASGFATLESTFGNRFAYNARGSHSGWNMPRAYLAEIGGWYAAEVGPFGPHQRAVAAVVTGKAEVAALDSLVWALLCRHDPTLAGSLRVVGRTTNQPIPPLVGSAAMDEADTACLRAALLELADERTGRALLDDVCLTRFAPARLGDYNETLTVGAALNTGERARG